MNELAKIQRRLRELEDREAIRNLVARYCYVIDNRDVRGIGECFTKDGRFRSRDGVLNASGRAQVVEQFHRRFAVLGPTLHWGHDHMIWFDGDDAEVAHGQVASHAELLRDGEPMIVALRYEDEYRRTGDDWRFSDRLLSFFYYCKVADYPEILMSTERMRAYQQAAPADFPEPLDTWRAYRDEA